MNSDQEVVKEQLSQTAIDIHTVCVEIEDLLVAKNKAYGDSALNPVRIFSKVDCTEQLKVRIDDKLSRMASSPNAFGEDVVLDLLGYLILLRIAQKREAATRRTIDGPPPVQAIAKPTPSQKMVIDENQRI